MDLNKDIAQNFKILEVRTNNNIFYYVYFKGIRIFYTTYIYDIENIIWDYAYHEVEDKSDPEKEKVVLPFN